VQFLHKRNENQREKKKKKTHLLLDKKGKVHNLRLLFCSTGEGEGGRDVNGVRWDAWPCSQISRQSQFNKTQNFGGNNTACQVIYDSITFFTSPQM
jgi:hypothetical protein